MDILNNYNKSILLFDDRYPEWLNPTSFPSTVRVTVVGNAPFTTTSSETFLQSLLNSSKETLETTYTEAHWVFLTDAQWVDYEPVLTRTLFVHGNCKLVVLALSPYDSDMMPLVNLVRANERAPVMYDQEQLYMGLKGYAVWNQRGDCRRKYAAPPHNPFFAIRDLVWPVTDSWSFLKHHLPQTAGHHVIVASKQTLGAFELKMKEEGFQRFDMNTFKKAKSTVTFYQPSKKNNTFYDDLTEIHVVDPPENIASTLFHCTAFSKSTTVYLHVPYTNPFEEHPYIHRYRATVETYFRRCDEHFCSVLPLDARVRETIESLFYFYPVLHRDETTAVAQRQCPDASKSQILCELDAYCASKMTIKDVFHTNGTIKRSGDNYYFYPEAISP
jgi:hypothetical protein